MMILQIFTHPACSSCGPVVADAWNISENNDYVEIQTVKLENKAGLKQAQSEGIRTIPSIIIKVSGEEVQRFVGTPNQGELETSVTAHLENMR